MTDTLRDISTFIRNDELLDSARAAARHDVETAKACALGHIWPESLAFPYCPLCRMPLGPLSVEQRATLRAESAQ